MNADTPKDTTIYDIAEKTGLSAATVSRVLNGKDGISEKTKEIVFNAAKEMHYSANTIARSLKTKKTYQIVVSIPDQGNPFWFDMIDQIHKRAKANDYSVLLSITGSNETEELKLVKKMRHNLADALIMVSVNITDKLMKELRYISQPVVLSGICLNTRSMQDVSYDYVGVDTYRGLYIATDYLIERGHKRIGYIGMSLETQPGRQRYQGYLDAMHSKGIEPLESDCILGGVSEEFGFNAAMNLINNSENITAICTSSDIIAFGVYKALEEMNIEIPNRVSLISMDNTSISAHIYPHLTSVAIYQDEIGRMAAEMVFRRLEGFQGEFQNVVYQPKLIERNSTIIRGKTE